MSWIRSARDLVRWLIAAAMATALALGMVVTISSTARAADVSQVIDTGSITIENDSTDDPDDPLVQWQSTRVSFDYNTQGVQVQPGDSFVLTLPPELRTVNLAWNLVHPDGTTIAACTAGGDPSTVTCTFTDGVLDADGSQKYDYLAGSVWVNAQAVQATESTTVDFGTVTGEVPVDLPGDGGIEPGTPEYPEHIDKWGWFGNDDRTVIHWQVLIPGSKVDNTIPVTVTDTMSPGQSITPPVEVQVLTNPQQGTWETFTDGVSLTVTKDGFTAVFAPGTIDPGEFYRITYYAKTDNSNVGQSYSNTAEIAGTHVQDTVTRNSQGGGTADGPGFGGIGVLKQPIAGDGASQVPGDAQFTMLATYTVDGVATTKKIAVTAGGAAGELHGLPVGTVVTLTEATPPAVPGITWGAPVFANPAGSPGVEIAPDGTSATITVGDQTTAYVEVTNTAELAPEPSVDIVKKDAAGNDADTVEQSVLLPDGSTDLVFTITNDGDEPLVDVVVSDEVTAGSGAVSDLSCAFPDGSAGTTWAGPFAVDASFTCTAQLTGVQPGEPHTDVASVTGKGQLTDKPVDDDNPYHAYTPEPKNPGNPGTPGNPQPIGPQPQPPTGKPSLAQTGVEAGGLGSVAFALIAAGLLAIAGGRRGRTAHHR
ncbi:collagen binding domain-containing protein [Blastococcus sp. Marseille-P5729]|uniref:collagen binding domain-containing protein n=1 Tax=Blastococcus sp. Marseille-P5729 TaxID=2086582 RepID=UPI000D0FDC60|nr:collagen binding domain-containing protein [Blastococcus sp. Marseille-P5729]